jgi:Flp pilus assembly protein TadD, contains TPR repeats
MKRLQIITTVFLFFFVGNSLSAQNWKQLSRSAKELEKKGEYVAAGQDYESAFRLKQSKKGFINSAGEAYLRGGDYIGAERAFGKILSEEAFPLAGLKYGRSIKSQGRYKEAKAALKNYALSYNGTDKELIQKLVDNEIAGCILAEGMENPAPQLTLSRLGNAVNSKMNDFAPIPFASGILYFTSARDKKTNILRSRLEGGKWSLAIEPKLPTVPIGAISQGSFSLDGQRFYFTVCKEDDWKGDRAECDIHVTQKKGNSWSAPIKLREYIKMGGTTAMYPYIVQNGNNEILYFSSDRPDGHGGMDIWYTIRRLDSDVFDFSFPRNAGEQINTIGDEITPFYDSQKKSLFFSSNGHPTLGGFDIFRSSGTPENWKKPENLKQPVNSAANDFGYVYQDSKENIFLVSTRKHNEKEGSNDADIYSINSFGSGMFVEGTVTTQSQRNKKYKAALYEITANGQKQLLVARFFESEKFKFDVLPERNLKLEVTQSGAPTLEYVFNTHDTNQKIYKNNFKLGRRPGSSSRATASSISKPVPKVNSPSTSAITTEKNKNYSGTYYKIQLTVVVSFNEQSSEYNKIKSFGNIDTEYLPIQGWTRVLLTPFFTLREARDVMNKVQAMGYPDAFPVRYKDGKRMSP